MAFFPRALYNADSSFTPLFRLLDDFDTYSRQAGGHSGRRPGLQHWQPKFDVRETGDAYELHGELPGMNKQDVHIEFTDPQTMLVRGKVERTYTTGTPPAGQIEDAGTQAITAGEEDEPKNAHRATVEDDNENVSSDNAGQVVKKAEEKKPADGAKFWLSERSIGEFSRSFNFPSRVDQDAVSASFKDGILSVIVPKAKKHESRRIAIE